MSDYAHDASKVSIRAQDAAKEAGIDPSQLRGTGFDGRVRLSDVEQHLEQNPPQPQQLEPQSETPPSL